ncbi:hypothetical protein P154DRAFT_571951 [Amniculicola lignicola CBS 123094]|uniref:BTB domain-containing protein n=1 Tax=Amniculicola lignicola CBS 123094 TaxID=1392246 RepID=A0A6A5WUH7_9PLEO|nr:hypothetical protein P154DRAFT_571951 [Amniculicola lignicola CBS 123094]
MANGNIGNLPASSYAEYVPASPELPSGASAGALAGASESDHALAAALNAPTEAVPQLVLEASMGYPGVRPALVHRLYSHRLQVRAQAKLQRDRLLSGAMVDVYVGEARRHWTLHRNLLCHHSELLETELQGDSKKKHITLELPDHDPAGFELLVKWLYQGRLDDVADMADPNQKYDYAVSCHKLYLLCGRFDMPQLKNVAMDQYRKGLSQAQLVPDADEIDAIYRKSTSGDPFRRLMTRIAARQIMDPASDRDVETYRECFENNPDFAIDLVKAIKLGTGGMLFDDPTEGDECEYHDHEAGPNCHIKGKGKVKQALKATAPRPDPRSAKSAPLSSHPPLRPPPPPQAHNPPPPPPRQARRQDGTSAGPLRRRLTSPASSTVETSTEHAIAAPPSPKEQRDKFRRVAPPEKRAPVPSPALTESLLPALEDHPQSSDEGFHRPLDSATSDDGKGVGSVVSDTSPKRGIWEWARVGTGRLGLIGRIPNPTGIMSSRAVTSAVNGALQGGTALDISQDDFSVPSSTSTLTEENGTAGDEATAARMEGFGISTSTVDSSLFSQTKRSSDDLAASVTGSPSPQTVRSTGSIQEEPDEERSPPATPSPQQRIKNMTNGSVSNGSPSPRRIPKYKIALASSILSPGRSVSASTS